MSSPPGPAPAGQSGDDKQDSRPGVPGSGAVAPATADEDRAAGTADAGTGKKPPEGYEPL
jgi:hypothetical protein